jgi:hypothetical protein
MNLLLLFLDWTCGVSNTSAASSLRLMLNSERTRNRYTIIIFANLWQFLISILYIQCNALLTAFCVEAEWQSYSLSRKSLRVFSPKGLQRSTYFISIPLKYGLTLQLAFAFFHWILSQSVFLIEVESVHPASREVQNNVPFFGSSPKGITIGKFS